MPTLVRWLRNVAVLALGCYLAMLTLADLVKPHRREMVETVPVETSPAKTLAKTVEPQRLSTVFENLPFVR